jgi:nucleoside phosphorylase
MEGASFLKACRAFNSHAYLFKVVSDTPEDSDLHEIVKSIKKTRDILYRYMVKYMQDFIQL